ncbi:MAG: tRNA dihydrouridine synthase DusB [Methanosarcinaceae archaeon]|nr:tRNA dihydrouridine synthase DusB [Methanosarcinaceae archaeon]MDF1533369.1 tRNA dihydrouridine synthase DusB [Methanosarcinaceae archaeon]
MKIANISLPNNLFLAPMANVTNLAFRMLCKKYGASLTYSEMISADAVVRQGEKTMQRGMTCEDERPFCIQIFGNSPETITEAALILEEIYKPAIIDVNMGCPAPLIVRQECGSVLLNFPSLVYDIVNRLTDNISTPVSAKIRVVDDMEKTLEIARTIEDAGACAITVHGRTREQMYSGTSSLKYAKAIKKELSIPVIANGDIKDGESAKHALQYTGCDGIMIGRAAIGHPYIFRQISHYLENGESFEFDHCTQQVNDFMEYIVLLEKYGIFSLGDVKAQSKAFTKGVLGSRHIREELNDKKTIESIIGVISEMCAGTD